jgi:hypothetical protein
MSALADLVVSATMSRSKGADMWAKRFWSFLRYSRWLLGLGWLAFCAEFVIHRQQHLDPFGHLVPVTEFLMFSLPLAAVFAGCFELMMREKAGITRSRDSKVGLGR